jgi:hypothetical protein
MENAIRDFLASHSAEDFADGEDFAEKLIKNLGEEKRAAWNQADSVASIKKATSNIYEFYRLVDTTPFEGDSPVKLRFGGADKRSIKFFERTDKFYFHRIGTQYNETLTKFFREQYLEQGGAIFGNKSQKELDDFRRAAGAKVAGLNNRQVQAVIHTSVQRIRVWGHVGSLAQGEIEEAEIVAIIDKRTTQICRSLNGKKLMVGTAQKTIEKLNKLSPEAFGKRMYESRIARGIEQYGADFFKRFVKKGRVEDRLVRTGRGFPPFHPNCRTRLKALY